MELKRTRHCRNQCSTYSKTFVASQRKRHISGFLVSLTGMLSLSKLNMKKNHTSTFIKYICVEPRISVNDIETNINFGQSVHSYLFLICTSLKLRNRITTLANDLKSEEVLLTSIFA